MEFRLQLKLNLQRKGKTRLRFWVVEVAAHPWPGMTGTRTASVTLRGSRSGRGVPRVFGGGRGRERGFAWGDNDGDGICDYTGLSVRLGRGRGRGVASAPAQPQTKK